MANVVVANRAIEVWIEIVLRLILKLPFGGDVDGLGVGVIHHEAVMVAHRLAQTHCARVVDRPAGGRRVKREAEASIRRRELLSSIGEQACGHAVDGHGVGQVIGMKEVVSGFKYPVFAELVFDREIGLLGELDGVAPTDKSKGKLHQPRRCRVRTGCGELAKR